ncbi:MAG: PAS domain S-box protein [Cryomorphaceae bacterium]|nr:PAS domain S-box protein [Cryomorphaceae bacterium]
MTPPKPDYSSFFYLNPLPSWVYDIHTFQILDVNQAAIDHYGFTKQEFLNLSIKDLRPKNEIPTLVRLQKESERKGKNIYFGVFTHQKKDGKRIRMKINGHKLDDVAIESMMVMGQDVTSEELHLKQLVESESRRKAASSIARVGYWRLDPDAKSLSWTDEVYDIWGLKKDEFDLNYNHFLQTIHPDDRVAFEAEQRASFAGDKTHDITHRIVLPDGRIRWVHQLGRLVTNEYDNTIAFEGTVQDVTAHKEEEHRLKLLESVITNTHDAVLITDANPLHEPGPKIIYVNDAFTKMTGYFPDEIIGKTPRILQGPKSDQEALARLGRALRNFESCEITTINYKKTGEEFWVNFSVSPVSNEHGKVTHFIAIERDVTEQKEKELEKELLGKISLDFSIEYDLLDSAKNLCKTLCEYGEFDFVELWLPNLENTKIQLVAHQPATQKAEIFYELSKDVKSFQLAEGLPGRVWQKESAMLWKEINKKEEFVRKEAAEKAGINTALGIPLSAMQELAGVLIIGTHREESHLQKYVNVFKQLPHYVGSELNRKKLEKDLQHIYNAIPDIVCITDLHGKFLKINKSGCDLIGYDKNEIINATFEKFVHPDDLDNSHKDLARLNKGFKTYGFENRYVTKSGKIIWLSWTSNTNLQEGLIYATARNISVEKKLRELNKQASKLARIGSWEVDLVQNKVFWSDMVHEIHETDPNTFVPYMESSMNFYREDFREMVYEAANKCLESNSPFDYEAVIQTAKKNERWIRAIGHAEIVDGKFHRIFGSFQDIHQQKLNEIALKKSVKSLEDYKFSLDQSAIIAFTDKEGVITHVNDNFCKISQYERSELIGNTHQLINSNHHPKSFFVDLWKTIASGKVWRGEIKNLAKDGSHYWVDTTIVPFLDEKKQPFQYLAIRFDVTSRKAADEKVIKTLEEKTKILESIGEAFFAVDKNWIVTYWNKEAEKLVGKKRKEILGKNLWSEFPDALELEFGVQYHLALKTGTNVNFEEYYPAMQKWLEVSAYPSNEGLSVFFKDITRKKEAEMHLHIANERFEKVSEATNDAIWDWNIKENTLYWGDGYAKLFGFKGDKFTTSINAWSNHIHPEFKDQVVKSVFDVLKDSKQTHWTAEYSFQKSDRSYVDVVDNGVVIRDLNGEAIRMVGAVRDISERKNFEKQLLNLNQSLLQHARDLELSNEQLEQFAFIASHDLQEPLRMISSFLDQLKRKYNDQLDAKAHQYIFYATDGAKRMKQIILDLLEYSRAGKFSDALEETNLNEIVADYQLLRRKVIAECSAVFNIEKLPVIQFYKAPLVQTLHCLLDNAMKYARENVQPIISVSAEENDDFQIIRIQDNGIGIESHFFEKIFVIFQRLHNRDKFEGTGIGLSIAKKHVESWGGTIWLESTPNEGSIFYFSIPKKHTANGALQ